MIYLVVSIILVLAGLGLYIRAKLLGLLLSSSSYVIFALFAFSGMLMTYVSLQEIDEEQYTSVEKMVTRYPTLSAVVEERAPRIYRYEYLDILQEYRQLSKKN